MIDLIVFLKFYDEASLFAFPSDISDVPGECFPFQYLMPHDVLLEFRLFPFSQGTNVSRQTVLARSLKISLRQVSERIRTCELHLYNTVLGSRADSLRSCRKPFWISDCSLLMHGFVSTQEVYLQRCLVVTWLVPRGTVAVAEHVLRKTYNYAPVYVVIQSHIRKRYMCL